MVREPAVIHDGIYDTGMHKVSIIAKLSKFDQLKSALNDLGVTGMTPPNTAQSPAPSHKGAGLWRFLTAPVRRAIFVGRI